MLLVVNKLVCETIVLVIVTVTGTGMVLEVVVKLVPARSRTHLRHKDVHRV